MPQKKMVKASDLSGISIFQDPKRGTVFYDYLTKRAYNITTSDVRGYVVYSSMLPLCLAAAFAMMSLFSLDYLSTLLIFLVTYLFVEILFRVLFLSKLPYIENWKPIKRDNLVVSMARKYPKLNLIILILLFIALTILMPLYAKVINMDDFNKYASYIISVCTACGAVISVMALYTKSKNNY